MSRATFRAAVLFAALLAIAAVALPAVAQEATGDSVTIDRQQARIGEQARLEIDVSVPAGSTAELDPASESWAGVEVVRVANQRVTSEGDRDIYHFEVVVAGFLPGQQSFAPAVNVISGTDIQPRQLPLVTWEVVETLPADAPLELTPLDPPVAIGGAESPWLRPAIAAGVVVGVALLALLAWLLGRWLVRRLRRQRPRPVLEPLGPPLLSNAEALMAADPVAAYRELAAIVRHFVAREHRFPAYALTTDELRQRMEAEGVDRWQARLVAGLLENCDSVVYAGYRPAMERREADLDIAREIVGEP